MTHPPRITERTPSADLWRNTLSLIPSVFGRMAYLASVRDPQTGRYEHHGLALEFGPDEAALALKKSHTRTFAEWLAFDIPRQKEDLDVYLESVFDKWALIEEWTRTACYRRLIPLGAKTVQKNLFTADFTTLLELFKTARRAP